MDLEAALGLPLRIANMSNSWPIFVETEQHRKIRDAIRAELGAWRRFVIAVDGFDGVGKSNFARYLAWQLGMPAIETGLCLDREKGGLRHHLDRLASIVEARASLDRPLIIEGLCILHILKDLNLACDFLVWVEQDGRDGSQCFGPELAHYCSAFAPQTSADAVFRRLADDGPEVSGNPDG